MNSKYIAALGLLSPMLLNASASHAATYRGNYLWDSEHSDFRPCGSSSLYYVGTGDEHLKEIMTYYKANKLSAEDDSVYIKFEGKKSPSRTMIAMPPREITKPILK